MNAIRTRGSSHWKIVLPLAFLALGVHCPPSRPPQIDSLNPNLGPSGTIVRVNGSGFSLGKRVYFDGNPISATGSNNLLVFTVPYDAISGGHTVYVEVGSNISNTVAFQVTSTVAAQAPVVEGYEVGYYYLGPSSIEDRMEIVIFGRNFDTNCRIVYDGNEIGSYFPGVLTGSLLGILAGGTTLSGYPSDRIENIIIGYLTADDGNIPSLGSTHDISIKNRVTGVISNSIAARIPDNRILIEIDKVNSVDWPPLTQWRNNTVNTLRRTYTTARKLIDVRYDETVADPLSGAAFTDGDLVDFFETQRTLSDETYTNEWYMHVAMLTTHTGGSLGVMYDVASRQGVAVFSNQFVTTALGTATEKVLRTLIHEIGHGFNLTHCEGDAVAEYLIISVMGIEINLGWTGNYTTLGTTTMNQTRALNANWTYSFSNASMTHLRDHLIEVEPGSYVDLGVFSIPMVFNSAFRDEDQCDH